MSADFCYPHRGAPQKPGGLKTGGAGGLCCDYTQQSQHAARTGGAERPQDGRRGVMQGGAELARGGAVGVRRRSGAARVRRTPAISGWLLSVPGFPGSSSPDLDLLRSVLAASAASASAGLRFALLCYSVPSAVFTRARARVRACGHRESPPGFIPAGGVGGAAAGLIRASPRRSGRGCRLTVCELRAASCRGGRLSPSACSLPQASG